jgi:16S rRNA (cytidine1402-2'-O)-methyltransferase
VLRAVDVIACEDTRVTAKLLAIHAIARPLVRYDEHTAARTGPDLVRRIGEGGRVALVSDAGTPLISDPGDRLVGLCLDQGLPVVPVPGASSVLTALMVAGLPVDRFLFAGFLPTRGTARRRALTEVAAVPASLVFLEGPTRLAAALADMVDVLGPRPAAVGREMTKLHEEVSRGSLAELAETFAAAGPPRGEVTVVVGPPAAPEPPDATAIDALLTAALSDGGGPKQAAQQVAAATGIKRTTLYRRALDLKDELEDGPE